MALADTGYWIALANRRDRWHTRAIAATKRLAEPLVVTWPVLTETCHLLLARLGIDEELQFMRQVARVADIHEIHADRLPEIQTLMEQYRDLPMDLADASLVLAANDLQNGRILSTDQRDFRTYRWKERQPFHNLLIEP